MRSILIFFLRNTSCKHRLVCLNEYFDEDCKWLREELLTEGAISVRGIDEVNGKDGTTPRVKKMITKYRLVGSKFERRRGRRSLPS